MLTIATDTLPQTRLSYVAFRVAFQETLERMVLARHIAPDGAECFGFLTEVPFLKAVAPHVQLDLLIETWGKHMASEPVEADLVDESIVYAACETSARVAESDPQAFLRYMRGGPRQVRLTPDHFLAAELRSLHLNLATEAHFLTISQFEDLPPDEALPLKEKFGLSDEQLEPLFEVLGLWTMSARFIDNLKGLLARREIVRAVKIVGGE